MAQRSFGRADDPILNPITISEFAKDVDGDNVTVSVTLAAIDDGSGFSPDGRDAVDVSWLDYTATTTTPQDVTEINVDLTVDPADVDIGKTYRVEVTADDGTDPETIQRDFLILNEFPFMTFQQTPDDIWDNRFQDETDLSPSTVASARCDVDISSGDNGVIMEAGAGGNGMALASDGSTLYFACGDGSSAQSTTDTAWITTPLPTGNDILIGWSASAETDTAALYVDGDLIGTDSFAADSIAGTNAGGIGIEHGGGIRALPGGVDTSSQFQGTIRAAYIFLNYTTPEVG